MRYFHVVRLSIDTKGDFPNWKWCTLQYVLNLCNFFIHHYFSCKNWYGLHDCKYKLHHVLLPRRKLVWATNLNKTKYFYFQKIGSEIFSFCNILATQKNHSKHTTGATSWWNLLKNFNKYKNVETLTAYCKLHSNIV